MLTEAQQISLIHFKNETGGDHSDVVTAVYVIIGSELKQEGAYEVLSLQSAGQ